MFSSVCGAVCLATETDRGERRGNARGGNGSEAEGEGKSLLG